MWKIKNINYNNLFILLIVFVSFSCQKEKCTILKPKSSLSILSGVLINDTLIVTIEADTIPYETVLHHIIGFDKNGNRIFTKARNEYTFMLSKQGREIYAYNPILPKVKVYNDSMAKESNASIGFLYLFPKSKQKAKDFAELGITLYGENYFIFCNSDGEYKSLLIDENKEYNQTSFQGFAGDSHVYNDTLYVEDKCFCIERK